VRFSGTRGCEGVKAVTAESREAVTVGSGEAVIETKAGTVEVWTEEKSKLQTRPWIVHLTHPSTLLNFTISLCRLLKPAPLTRSQPGERAITSKST
jgi:hypothetical protein